MSDVVANRFLRHGAIAAMVLALCGYSFAESNPDGGVLAEEEIRLWPDAAPGTEHWTGEEVTLNYHLPAGKIIIKTNITVPALTLFRPPPDRANGTAMLVLPGGGFGALAWDLEGTEVARWLADRGIAAFVLKYRIGPISPSSGEEQPESFEARVRMLEPAWKIAVADAGQAVRLLRERASDYGIDPERIGMIGFSAGAATMLGTVFHPDPTVRPNFAVSMYGLLVRESPLPADAPPLFIAATQADATVPAASSTHLFELWSKQGLPAELHIYGEGEHGFGMRSKGLPVDHWPAALEAWLDSLGLLSRADGRAPAGYSEG